MDSVDSHAMAGEEHSEARQHTVWYGAVTDDISGGSSRSSWRSSAVLAGSLGIMALVVVIAPMDMRLSKPDIQRTNLGAGRFVVSETDTLLSKAAAEVRLQKLLDVGSVTAAAQKELASDVSAVVSGEALKSISNSRAWFAGKDSWQGHRLSSAYGDGGPAGAIIASATDVYEKASKLAGDSGILPSHLSQADSELEAADDAADDASLPASTRKTKTPFAHDKGFSVAREKSDMDHFYDSLDHKAAVKEAKARQKRASTAAFRATVAKAKAELKQIESKPVVQAEVKQKTVAVTPQAAVPKTTVVAPKVTDKNLAVVAKVAPSAPKAIPTLPAAAKGAVFALKAIPKVAAASPKAVFVPKIEGTKMPKMPKLSSEASRQKIMGYFDALVNKAKSRADLEHPVEKNPSLSAGAARSTMALYFNSLESTEKALLNKVDTAEKKQVKPTANSHLTDAESKKSALSFFDSEVTKARAQAALVAKKLGVRKGADTVEHLQMSHSAAVAVKPQTLSLDVKSSASVAAIAVVSAGSAAAVRAQVKSAQVPVQVSSTDTAAAAAYNKAFEVRHPAPKVAAPKVVESKVLSKAAAHSLAAAALKQHDRLQIAAQQHLLQTQGTSKTTASSNLPSKALVAPQVAAHGAGGKTTTGKASPLVRAQLEQWNAPGGASL